MIIGILSNETAEVVLLYLAEHKESYAQEIADNFKISTNLVQRQLAILQSREILKSRLVGRTRTFTWNTEWPYYEETIALLHKAIALMNSDVKTRYFTSKTSPLIETNFI